ncbi:MAG: hypothetical protein Q4A21_01015 [bacterium]|nr:hypothetical protein [bacterium]
MKQGEERPLSRRERRAQILESQGGAAEFSRGKTLSRPEKPLARAENRKLILRRRKIGGFFFWLLGASIFILVLLWQLVADISVVDSKGRSLDKKYAQSIEKYYQRQPFERVISQLKKQDLLVSVQRDFSEILDISDIKFQSFGRYKFELKMRQAVAVWGIGGKKLFVDENGVAFENNFAEEPALKITDEGIQNAGGGVAVASSGFMRFIGRLISFAGGAGLKISSIKIPANTLRQVEVSFEGLSYPVRFSSVESAEGQIANLKRSINYFSAHGQTPQYLDLRVEGKAYYK